MFDEAPSKADKKPFTLDELAIDELLDLRADIDALLPARNLADMDMEHELVIQFMTVRALQTEVLASEEESNKKSTVCNSVATVMQQLVKMQTEIHTSERLKQIETHLIRAMDKIPEKYLVEFFKWYEEEAK